MGQVAATEVSKERGQWALISNQMTCHCGRSSVRSGSWWVVQDWWRTHGYGEKCR